jgi:hypothetical protein
MECMHSFNIAAESISHPMTNTLARVAASIDTGAKIPGMMSRIPKTGKHPHLRPNLRPRWSK